MAEQDNRHVSTGGDQCQAQHGKEKETEKACVRLRQAHPPAGAAAAGAAVVAAAAAAVAAAAAAANRPAAAAAASRAGLLLAAAASQEVPPPYQLWNVGNGSSRHGGTCFAGNSNRHSSAALHAGHGPLPPPGPIACCPLPTDAKWLYPRCAGTTLAGAPTLCAPAVCTGIVMDGITETSICHQH